MSAARLRFLLAVSAHEKKHGCGHWYRPCGVRGFAAAANSAEKDGLVLVTRARRGEVDGVLLTEDARNILMIEAATAMGCREAR